MTTFGPIYPAPGGTTFSSTGTSSRDGGQTRTYSGLDVSVNDFWWGLTNIGAAMDGAIDSPSESLTFTGFSLDGLTATWTGTTTTAGYGGTIYTLLTVSIDQPLSGGATWTLASGLGFTGGPSELIDIDETVGSFVVNVAFSASLTDGSGYDSFLDLYDAVSTADNTAFTNSSGLFFAQGPAIYTFTTSSALAWMIRDGTIASVSGTLVVIANSDGTETRLTGTGFTGDTTALTGGTISQMDRTTVSGAAVLETITNLNYSAVTFSNHLAADADLRNIFADVLSGDDTVTGASGNDFLVGGAGADAINGAGGFDFADYANAAGSVTASLATPGSNTGDAAGDTYTSIEAIRGSDFVDTLTGDSQSNFLRGGLGADILDGGSGFDFADYGNVTGGLTVNLATPGSNSGEAIGDTFTSIEGLAGGSGNDTLVGNTGDNFLRGRGGGDVHNGGAGVDWADYQGSTLAVTVNLTNPALNTNDALGDTYISIEGIRGTGLADVLTGDNLDNWIRGSGGADQINGGGGFDTASYRDSTIGLTIDLMTPGNNTGEGIGDTYTSIEGLEGTDSADSLFGDNNNNYLRGRGGADALDGRGGTDVASYANSEIGLTVSLATPVSNTGDAAGDTYTSIEGLSGSHQADSLTGNGGDNLLRGNGGADQLFGGGGVDTADYGASSIGLTIDLATPAKNTGEATGDTYSSIEGITGSDFNDIVRGDAGNNVLNGGGGNDAITGNNGNDTVNGGSGTDTVFLRGNRTDYTITLAGGIFTIVDSVAGRDGTDTLTNVETVIFADGAVAAASLPGTPVIVSSGGGATAAVTVAENATAVGTVLATQLDPTPALTYSIAGGADAALFQINPATGALTFIAAPNFEAPGDAGLNNVYDVVVRSSDGTLIDDQAIAVTVADVAEPPSPLFDETSNTVTLPSSGAWSALGGSDTVTGTAGVDYVDGGDGYDNLYGGGGNDTLLGGLLEDIVVGDAGDDSLYGGDGGDVVSELFDPVNSGNDLIDGGNGIDIMYAAAGNDIVYGGTDTGNNYGNLGDGNDSYFGSGGTDVVVAGNGDDTLNGNAGDDSLYGEVGNDTIYGGAGIDLLSGSTGNDVLEGGAGNDLLIGDDGADTLRGGAGLDVIYGYAGDDILNGGGGGEVDGLYGGAGNDTFQVGGNGFGFDYIWDWTVNMTPGASDQLVFQTGHFANVAAVRAASAFSGGNTTITVPDSAGAFVVLVGVNIANILDEDIVVTGTF